MKQILMVAALAATSVFGTAHASAPPSAPIGEEAGTKIVRFLSLPVQTESGRTIGQVDLVQVTGEALRVTAFREGSEMTGRDGRASIRQFGPDGKVTEGQRQEGPVKGYGARVVARSGGICVVVVYEILEDNTFRTLQVLEIPCTTAAIITGE